MPQAIANQYRDLWTNAKEEYREASGSKKPAEKRFWGVFGDLFRKSTGIGDACKDVDDALKNIKDKTGRVTKKGLEKAEEALDNRKEGCVSQASRSGDRSRGNEARGTARQGDEGIEKVAHHRREETGRQGSEGGGEGVG